MKKPQTPQEKTLEPGEASVRVHLRRGQLVVYHGDSGEVLHASDAKAGTWASLWEVIRSADS